LLSCIYPLENQTLSIKTTLFLQYPPEYIAVAVTHLALVKHGITIKLVKQCEAIEKDLPLGVPWMQEYFGISQRIVECNPILSGCVFLINLSHANRLFF